MALINGIETEYNQRRSRTRAPRTHCQHVRIALLSLLRACRASRAARSNRIIKRRAAGSGDE